MVWGGSEGGSCETTRTSTRLGCIRHEPHYVPKCAPNKFYFSSRSTLKCVVCLFSEQRRVWLVGSGLGAIRVGCLLLGMVVVFCQTFENELGICRLFLRVG